MDINKLTAEERELLKRQFEAEAKTEAEAKAAERAAYKDIVDETVREQVEKLLDVSRMILDVKRQVFNAIGAVVEMKGEIYGLRDKQQSHSFTTADGYCTVTIGHRVYEGWDDTANVGVAKVKEFIESMARDDNSAALVETVMRLLARDKKGNLKASRILELDRLADRVKSPAFSDAIRIIKDAYRPTPTCRFVEAAVRGENGVWRNIPLSMSAIDITAPDGADSGDVGANLRVRPTNPSVRPTNPVAE